MVSLLSIPKYRHFSQKAISVLVCMPTTYFCEQGFSALVKNELKKKQNQISSFLWGGPLKKAFSLISHKWRVQFSRHHIKEDTFSFLFTLSCCSCSCRCLHCRCGRRKGPWRLKCAAFSRKKFISQFHVGKMKFHNCCPLDKSLWPPYGTTRHWLPLEKSFRWPCTFMSQILCCPSVRPADLRSIHRLLQARHSTMPSILKFCYFGFIFDNKGHGPRKTCLWTPGWEPLV